MNKNILISALLFSIWPAWAWQENDFAAGGAETSRTMAFAQQHLEIGVGITYTRLRETTRREFDEEGVFTGGFLGSIDKLHVEQENMLTPIIRLKWNEYFGLQIGYTSFAARTTTFWDGHTDGNFKLSGPTFEVYARARPMSGFAPYASVGVAVLNGNFQHDELWHNGFSPRNPEAYRGWVNAGRPAWPNGGYRRNIDLSNTTALLISGGCVYHISENWMIDLSVQYMSVDVDADFYLSWYDSNRRDQGSYTIPMSNVSTTLGIVYRF